MRIVSSMALAAALGLMTAGAPALAKDKPPKEAPAKYTPAVQNALAAAQKALAAGDTATAQAKIDEAKPAIATDDDKYVTGSVLYQLGQKTNDQAKMSEGIDLMADSGKAKPDLQQQLLVMQGKLAYQAKDYRKAETKLQAAQQAGSTDKDLIPVLVASMANNGETLQALNTLSAAIDKNIAANQPTPAEWFQQGVTLGYSAKAGQPDLAAIHAATTELTKKWVAAYPTKSNWHDALRIYLEQNHPDTDTQIDLFRLQLAAGALLGDGEYREYAENVYLRYPNEAATLLQDGSAKGIVNLTGKTDAAEVLNAVKPKIPADKASLAGSDKAARAAANGKAALNTADAFASYGDYAKAIDLYKVAVTKGGIDAATANLRMGRALALSGDTAGAKAAFASVTGPRKALAYFWVIHLDHPTVG